MDDVAASANNQRPEILRFLNPFLKALYWLSTGHEPLFVEFDCFFDDENGQSELKEKEKYFALFLFRKEIRVSLCGQIN